MSLIISSPNCICSLWFTYACGDRPYYGRSPHAYVNQRLQIQLGLLMMSDIPLETCWAFNVLWNNKFRYQVASCWLLLLRHNYITVYIPRMYTQEDKMKCRLQKYNLISRSVTAPSPVIAQQYPSTVFLYSCFHFRKGKIRCAFQKCYYFTFCIFFKLYNSKNS